MASAEPIELIEPFGFPTALGGGDCVANRSPLLSDDACGADEKGVPSDVWMFRLAAGRLEGAGACACLLLDLNRNAIAPEFSARREVLRWQRGLPKYGVHAMKCSAAAVG